MDRERVVRSTEVGPLGSEIVAVEKSGTDEKPYGGRVASALAGAVDGKSSGMGVGAVG